MTDASEGWLDEFDVNWEAVSASVDGSTCCVVVLKYRARLGRRKVGGRTVDGIRTSQIDFLTVLLNIVSVY
jgi:hypothetical protein